MSCAHFLLYLIRFFPNFIYGLLPSNPGSSLNMSFVQQMISKMADKMAATYQFASIRSCGHSNLVIFNQIFLEFHIWVASIRPWFKIEYEFCPTNDKQDGRQNGRNLSVCIHPLLWSLLVIFNRIFSQFNIRFASIKPWFKFEYEFCLTNNK